MLICSVMNLIFHFILTGIRFTNHSTVSLSIMIIGDIRTRRNYHICGDPCLRNGLNPTVSHSKWKSG